LGISVCEDAWNNPEFWPRGRMYSFDPIEALAQKRATLFINISSSPYHIGKEEIRYQLISRHALRHHLPFCYVNQVGGNDDLIFDGRSLICDRSGNPLLIGPGFEEWVSIINPFEENAQRDHYQPQGPIETVFQALVLGVRDYMFKCGFRKAVSSLPDSGSNNSILDRRRSLG